MAKVNRGGKRLQGGKYHKYGLDLQYGDEYKTILELKDLNVKIIVGKIKENESSAPQDSATPNRIYAIFEENNPDKRLKSFIFYNEQGRRYKQIDRDDHKINGKNTNPHTHFGYVHNENGDDEVSKEDLKLIAEIEKRWYNYKNGR